MKIQKYIDDKGKSGWYTLGNDGSKIVCKYDKKTNVMEKTTTILPAPKPEDRLKRHYGIRIAAANAKGDAAKAKMIAAELEKKLNPEE